MPSYSALPEPMLARSGQLPTRGDYAYELKWDGFRAVVSTEPASARSRRGWDMTATLYENASQNAEMSPVGNGCGPWTKATDPSGLIAR